MASSATIYNSLWYDMFRGNIDLDSDTVKVMLVNGYSANKDTHTKRSDVTGEVTGTGYTAGGVSVTVTVAEDNTNDRVDATLPGNTWATATITATGAVYYKSRGGAASADELVMYVDFGGEVSSTADNFALSASTLRLNN